VSGAQNADGSLLIARRKALWPLLAVTAAFGISRIGYHVAGVRFDASSLPWFWQFIDPALLKANLWQSLWYLHSQPPMFNLFLGIVLNLFPGHESAAFAVCYLLFGLIFAVTLFLLLRGFGASDVLSAVAAAVYVASPTVVLYENWLFYAYPVTVLLLLAALFWQRFVQGGRFRDALLVFVCAASLALTWSLFHVVWLLALAFALVLVRRQDWRKVLAAGAVPVLIVGSWYGKNLVQFGQFTGSTWFGMNFSRMTNNALTKQERQALYYNGAVSAVSFYQPFRIPATYYGAVAKPQPTGIPVLDQEIKPSGSPNFNNAVFIAVSRQFGDDALRILGAYPAAYLRSLLESYLLAFQPASVNPYLDANIAYISGLVRIESMAVDGRFGHRTASETEPLRNWLHRVTAVGWFLILAYAFVLVVALILLFRPSSLLPSLSSLFFLWFNVAWMTFVSNALEVSENNRFRFTTDPLVLTCLVAVTAACVEGLSSRRRSARA